MRLVICKRNIMVVLVVLMIAITFCAGQENAKITYEDKCNKVGHTLTINAEYTGDGTPSSVTWSYSGDVGSFLEIQTSNCKVFGSVPVGFPDSSRLSYECVTTDPSLPSNIFKLKVSELLSNETDKTWGATFTPPVGVAPAAVELGVPTICTSSVWPKDCDERVIASIVIGSLGIIALAVAIIFILVKIDCSKPDCQYVVVLALLVLCIVFDIISLALSASVLDDKDCKDCPDWILNSAIAFVVVPSSVAVAAIVLIILICCGVIEPGKTGGNGFFCFNNGNDDGNDGGNDSGNNGHHRGRGTNSSTVHTERADTHRGTLSDRANSEGEVSRKDVHVQEKTGDNFSGRRPMPPIPLTDKKGRGLSANYDDEHPMISVGIPDKKAGDLGPLEEESKKKKKKKKKTKNDDDEREKEENKE